MNTELPDPSPTELLDRSQVALQEAAALIEGRWIQGRAGAGDRRCASQAIVTTACQTPGLSKFIHGLVEDELIFRAGRMVGVEVDRVGCPDRRDDRRAMVRTAAKNLGIAPPATVLPTWNDVPGRRESEVVELLRSVAGRI